MSQKLNIKFIYRGLPGVASITSKFDGTNICNFRDMTIFVIFSKISFSSNFEIPNPVVGGCQSTPEIANLVSKYDC